uniref:Uncharacterized protein n=2 Tax=unclassified Prevotella TaxID=2638335 RepID=A0AB33IWC6_9BACT
MNKNIHQNGHVRNLLYKFKSTKSNLWYIVIVEQYQHHVFAVKFYPKKWTNSKYKYQKLTNTNEPRRIINTCINVMLSIYEQYQDASFGFIGASRINEGNRETKRYKVYSTIVATYFSDQYFFHKENKDKSAYLLINSQKLSSHPTLVSDIENFFKEQYYFD